MSKPKVYYCTKTKDFLTCGESDPANFIPGRYSTCKACRNKYVREHNKEKKASESEEKNKEIDPGSNIRYLIIDTIRYAPIINGKSVEEKIRGNEDDISDVLCTNSDSLDAFKKEMLNEFIKMNQKIKELENEIVSLKSKKS
jgi:hypothetical protein